MSEIDLIIRGGAAALLLVFALRWIATRRSGVLGISAPFFALGVMAYLALSHPQMEHVYTPEHFTLAVLSKLSAYFLWLFALAMFDDDFRLRIVHILPAPLIFGLAAVSCSTEGHFPEVWGDMITAAFFVHVPFIAMRGQACDLVCSRIGFRFMVAFALPFIGVVAVLAFTTGFASALGDVYALIEAAMIFAAALGLVLATLRLDPALAPHEHADRRPARERGGLSPADRIDLARLTAAIEAGICFENGLTIGMLADRVNVPEHRLRRLINAHLGYRNFNAFLNDHRIGEAQRRLADPELAREQIIQHAFALGYASLAPFNRAFRERTGMSPTAFRKNALERAVAGE
ncbi:MAG: helix-turn-helix transcriptional regulator [Rubricella sp.]